MRIQSSISWSLMLTEYLFATEETIPNWNWTELRANQVHTGYNEDSEVWYSTLRVLSMRDKAVRKHSKTVKALLECGKLQEAEDLTLQVPGNEKLLSRNAFAVIWCCCKMHQ